MDCRVSWRRSKRLCLAVLVATALVAPVVARSFCCIVHTGPQRWSSEPSLSRRHCSKVGRRSLDLDQDQEVDEDLKLVQALGLKYDPHRIEAYFQERPLELAQHAFSAAAAIVILSASALAGAAAAVLRSATAPPESSWAQFRSWLAPQVASVLCRLGPSYIKFGQSLASRPDLVTQELASEFVRLQDDLPPFPNDIAQRVLSAELGSCDDQDAAAELLRSLYGKEPVAAASLGQVYRGRVHGHEVAVKVQRPSVRQLAAVDAALLRWLAKIVEGLKSPVAIGPLKAGDSIVQANVVGAVDEFCSRLFEELDYSREAQNLERFQALYCANGKYAKKLPAPGIRAPKLERPFCSRRVLVMEWVDGERLASSEVISKEDMPLVELGISATLLQLLETGVMHTDPHGGNLLKGPVVEAQTAFWQHHRWRGDLTKPKMQLIYLDFGLVADVPLQVRDGLVCAVMYIVRRRWESVARLFNQLMLLPDWVLEDPETLLRFTRDLEEAAKQALVFSSTSEVPSLRFAALLEQLALLAPRYRFQLPPYFLNNARALGCLEGMARAADPEFNILRRMYPYALRRLLSSSSGSPVLRNTLRELSRDPETGLLSLQAAMQLVRNAAEMQGVSKRSVVFDVLSRPGGISFASELLWAEAVGLMRRRL